MNGEGEPKVKEEIRDTFEEERQKGMEKVRQTLLHGEFRRRMRKAADKAEESGVKTTGKGMPEEND